MTINVTHDGYDQTGAPTAHKGLIENCPAPECQDRVIEQQEAHGTYCPHGKKITELDPDHPDQEGQPERLVDPWPCTVEGCTLEAFEEHEQACEDEYWDSLLSEVYP
ncbi:hypothetical protein [Streptomyces prasinopilosus]|uniref:hypothetical protein n=1 Tax=Streptomyces prasinopilosus TaxID=67344 RepID=UPI0006EB5870|nr:hypothetical protein [Streptomyces prasinopilosus]